jgi:hypothetical protein|tara:strand:- start:881 stop:1075 length:195 start_codon:yes stop_codon:yes gene_type:complete
VECSGTGAKGEAVTFESEVVLDSDGFDEVGTFTYAGRDSVKFETIGKRYMAARAVEGINHGFVI